MIRTELRQNVKVRLALGTVLNHHRYMYKVGFKNWTLMISTDIYVHILTIKGVNQD